MQQWKRNMLVCVKCARRTREKYSTCDGRRVHERARENDCPLKLLPAMPAPQRIDDDYDPATSSASPKRGSCCDPPRRAR